jgi:transposase
VWRQDTNKAAEPRARLSRRALRWALEAIVCQHLTVAPVAEALAVSWDTANDAVLAEGWRVLIGDPNRLDGVAVIGVDEHCWRHTRRCEKYVTVIIDLTPVRDGAGPARLLDMVDGRSKMVAVMDPFHVVALAGDALERCRQRVQQETRGHRGRTGDPLYGIRRVLRTGSDLLTDR